MLVDLTGKIQTMNTQIMDALMVQGFNVSPDTQHTWFQPPVKFEDALGRVLPVPSEYKWGVCVLFVSIFLSALTQS